MFQLLCKLIEEFQKNQKKINFCFAFFLFYYNWRGHFCDKIAHIIWIVIVHGDLCFERVRDNSLTRRNCLSIATERSSRQWHVLKVENVTLDKWITETRGVRNLQRCTYVFIHHLDTSSVKYSSATFFYRNCYFFSSAYSTAKSNKFRSIAHHEKKLSLHISIRIFAFLARQMF